MRFHRSLALIYLILGMVVVLSACSFAAPKPPLSMSEIPLYPGAVAIETSQSKTATDNEQRAVRGVQPGDKFEFRAYRVLEGTTTIIIPSLCPNIFS